MTIATVREGDIVHCDVKGRRFHALVESKTGGHLHVRPIEPNISYRRVTARQVIGHWRRRRQSD